MTVSFNECKVLWSCSQKLAEGNFKRLWIIDPSGEMVHFLAANRVEGSEALKEFTGLGYRFAPPPSAQNECVFLAERENLSGWFSPLAPGVGFLLVNAGAIAACSMIAPTGDAKGKWAAICDNMAAMAGSDLMLIDKLYASESATDFNNRSIAWLLKNYGRIYDDPDMSLDLYTRQCSMGVTCEQLSIMAATIAFHGRNPKTNQQVFPRELAPKATSLIATVGFYQQTGDWMFKTGIPAKSGVGGGILGVMPGLFGIAAFAPPLNEAGNSVKGQAAIDYLMRKLDLDIFSGSHICQIVD